MIKWFLIIFAVWWIWDTWGWAVFGYVFLGLLFLGLLGFVFSGIEHRKKAQLAGSPTGTLWSHIKAAQKEVEQQEAEKREAKKQEKNELKTPLPTPSFSDFTICIDGHDADEQKRLIKLCDVLSFPTVTVPNSSVSLAIIGPRSNFDYAAHNIKTVLPYEASEVLYTLLDNIKTKPKAEEFIEPKYSDAVASIAPEKMHLVASGSVQRPSDIVTSKKSSKKNKKTEEEKAASILPATFNFAYQDSFGQSQERTVKASSISESNGFHYLEGYCHTRKDFRTFRTDRIRGSLTDMESGEILSVKQLLSSVHPRKAMTYKPAPAVTTKKEGQTAVLFTGFTAKRREELEELADAAGWDVRSTVGKTLDYLVTGPRAGPSKIAKAEELGVTVVDEDIFRALV